MMAAKDCIKNARFQLGLSQKEFSDLVGIGQQSICYYEIGKRHPTSKNVKKIVDALKKNGVEVDYKDLMEK